MIHRVLVFFTQITSITSGGCREQVLGSSESSVFDTSYRYIIGSVVRI